MTENNLPLEPKLQRSIDENAFRERSRAMADSIINSNPLGVNRDHMLKDSIVHGEINFHDALGVIRKLGLMGYPDPVKDRTGDDITGDLRLFVADRGGVINKSYQSPANEAHYIITTGVLMPNLRLPYVIEGVRQMIHHVENDDYSKVEDGARVKQEKIARMSNYLYELTSFQTDLITDELTRGTGKDWEETRKQVVEWKNSGQELEKAAEGNVRLRSLIEKPVYSYKDKKDTIIPLTPIDPMVNNPGAKAQKEPQTR
jgi:hypothetical protein